MDPNRGSVHFITRARSRSLRKPRKIHVLIEKFMEFTFFRISEQFVKLLTTWEHFYPYKLEHDFSQIFKLKIN